MGRPKPDFARSDSHWAHTNSMSYPCDIDAQHPECFHKTQSQGFANAPIAKHPLLLPDRPQTHLTNRPPPQPTQTMALRHHITFQAHSRPTANPLHFALSLSPVTFHNPCCWHTHGTSHARARTHAHTHTHTHTPVPTSSTCRVNQTSCRKRVGRRYCSHLETSSFEKYLS